MNTRTECCGQCPFARSTSKEYLDTRGQNGEKFVGQANGPFILPCHMTRNFDQWRGLPMDAVPQCAGAAKFRANIGVADKLPAALSRLPADTDTVFATDAELLAHHLGVPLVIAQDYLQMLPAKVMTMIELGNRRVQLRATDAEGNEVKL